MKQTFEDFLKDFHMSDYRGTDDDAPDAFDHWLTTLEQESLIRLADIFAKEQYLAGMQHCIDTFNKPILSV